MLQAKELRVGNTVFFPFHNENVEIIGLPLLENGKQGIQVFTKGTQLCEELKDQFKPIEITEKILLKFGFKKVNNKFFKLEILKCGLIHFYKKDNNSFYCELGQNWGLTLGFLNGLKYVHQLQNLYFSLTREELTIKN